MRGLVAPLMQIPLLSFPFSFELSTADRSVEYQSVERSAYDTLDLIVSARWDTDGVAATRGPEAAARGSGRPVAPPSERRPRRSGRPGGPSSRA